MPPSGKNQEFAGCTPDTPLVVFKTDFPASERRNWLPAWLPKAWESPIAPRDDSQEAMNQWFTALLHPKGLLSRLEEIRSGKRRSVDYGHFVRDAGRLIDYCNGVNQPKIPFVPPDTKFNLSEAVAALKDIRERLFPSFTPEEAVARSNPAQAEGTEKSVQSPKQRGRKPKYDPDEDRKTADEWRLAYAAGESKKDFAKRKPKLKTVAALDRLLNRVRAAKRPRKGTARTNVPA